MKTHLALLTVLLFSARSLLAQSIFFESPPEQVGLLELYTSEGCSSCPPADKWLTGLREHPGLWDGFIPMALHVDYWDYIGWEDPFASSAHSKRQRQYAREQSLKAVYTPGFVYNGSEWRQWYKSRAVKFPDGNRPGILKMQIQAASVALEFSPAANSSQQLDTRKDLQFNLALLGFGLETQVIAGENRGKKLPHDFVVLGMTHSVVGRRDGQYSATMQLPDARVMTGEYAVVAWLDTPRDQRPIQAVGGLLPTGYQPWEE